MIASERADVAYVCTPNNAHCDITVAALNAGMHVLCEKPMAASSADAKKMLDAAAFSGKKLTIGYQNRFRQDSQLLYQACRNGDLGDILFCQGARGTAPRRAYLGRVHGFGEAGRRPAL